MKKTRLLLFVIISSISFLQMDCKDDEPIKPCTDCPTQTDSTSHNFTFTTYTFGGIGGSSSFKDVVIINENDIWAVGEIYTTDSTYNAAHWDGKSWKLIKVYDAGNQFIGSLRGIIVLNTTEIWLTDGGIHRWDGVSKQAITSYSRIALIGGEENGQSVDKLWGYSSSNIYGVGQKGMITHYNGSTWSKLESGTTLDIQDIWGSKNEQSGEWEILAVASSLHTSFDRKIFRITNNTVSPIADSSIQYALSSVWFISNQQYYVAGSGIYEKKILNNTIWQNEPLTITQYYSHKIRGIDTSDVVAVGGAGEVIHYNGKSWRSFYDQTKLGNGNYYSVAIKNNLIVAVGQDNPQAVITVGKRQ
jgi:hypothetical protein